MTVTKSFPGSLRRPVHSAGYRRCTVYVYITSGAMASGDAGGSRSRVDRGGVSFRFELQTSWNAPESYWEWSSWTPQSSQLYEDAEPTRVLPGRAQNSVQQCARTGCQSEAPGVDMTNVWI